MFDNAATISGPIAENMRARLSVSHVQHDGYLKNVNPGVGNPDAANRTAVRASLVWQVAPTVTDTVRADYLYTHEQWATNDTFLSPTIGITWSDPLLSSISGRLDKVDVNTVPYQSEISHGFTNELSWRINDNLTLKSISAGRTDVSNNAQDFSHRRSLQRWIFTL